MTILNNLNKWEFFPITFSITNAGPGAPGIVIISYLTVTPI